MVINNHHHTRRRSFIATIDLAAPRPRPEATRYLTRVDEAERLGPDRSTGEGENLSLKLSTVAPPAVARRGQRPRAI